ncbi:hypothetical protein RFI_07996 [Reticulomyxa filosa]|uniref:MRG domain-containing protein n=1 Tax=Reticulomyxa filosa TaxID=46433 RepID=X6NSY5_RETFI|nr:hypothetical protein RFI_07996 [Reticulomyxa filosa]|eukprot:ETO29131.1 hypothetical protein RFI_07996 [Reticulomyxa filosa]
MYVAITTETMKRSKNKRVQNKNGGENMKRRKRSLNEMEDHIQRDEESNRSKRSKSINCPTNNNQINFYNLQTNDRLKDKISCEQEETKAVCCKKNQSPIHIHIPEELKKRLIVDWENITKHQKVLVKTSTLKSFPKKKKGERSPNKYTFCIQYVKYVQLMKLPRENGQRVIDILDDYGQLWNKNETYFRVVKGLLHELRDYFDQALETTLLYKFERPLHHYVLRQYRHLAMSQIYGVEHLCRFFVKLPELLNSHELDHRIRAIVEDQIKQLITFRLKKTNYIRIYYSLKRQILKKEFEKYFVKTYQKPDDEYLRKVDNMELKFTQVQHCFYKILQFYQNIYYLMLFETNFEN